MPKALITGITGQDGSYLAELLLAKGYEVHGLIRRASSFNTERLETIYKDPHRADARFFLHYGDLADSIVISTLIAEISPDEIYNLAAQSHVRVSFDIPEYTGDITALGSAPPPQDESTPFHPRSPYACAKVFAHNITVNYRESYNMFACGGILFNHESPRRG